MKIFLDSSVIIAALLSNTGGSAKILSFCETNIVTGYISKDVIEEIRAVLQQKFKEDQPLFEKLLKEMIFKTITVNNKRKLKEAIQWIDDPKDAKILAAAKQMHADYLITLDIKDFIKNLEVSRKSGLSIITPGDFLQNVILGF